MFLPDPKAAYGRALAATLGLVPACAVLGSALFLEHVAGVRPCHLCLLERWPWYVGILSCCLALGTAHLGRFPSEPALAAAALAFAFGAAFGAYHSGVEWGIWAGPEGCTGDAKPTPASVDAFLDALRGAAPVIRCDAVSYRLLGLSLANWNAACSLVVALPCAAGMIPRAGRALPALVRGLPASRR